MKKQLLALAFLLTGMGLIAQVPRMSLYEEFTGETCPPCAATNPGLDALLKSGTNPSKVIPIKWQVPIPSAPSNTWSLYRTNKTEIDWRYSQYGYGINSAPSARMDGQNVTVFGASSDHPAVLNTNVINTAAAVTTPFAINLTRSWDPTYSTVTLTVNISSQGAFTAVGNLVCRVVLIEKEVHFATQPGTNGEKDFNWPVRKSYPDIQNGTAMASTWTNGQTQQFVLTCPLPSYINDKAEVAFVAFIQDDGNKKVMQAAQTTTMAVANDARADLDISTYVCGGSFIPKLKINNNGNNAITAFNVTPKFDANVGTVYNWTGNLAAGASTVINLNSISMAQGVHTYSYIITNVSGTDFNPVNNSTNQKIVALANYDGSPVAEDFVTTSFPPADWSLYSPNSTSAWAKSNTVGGFGLSSESAKMDFFNISAGSVMDMVVKPLDLGGAITPTLTFDVAYAQYGSSYDDKLEVLVSDDCGDTWTNVYTKSGTTLMTRPPITSAFTPTQDEWRTETVQLAGFNKATVLVKFTATSDYGNNLYVDNVNLKQENPTGISSVANNNVSVGVYPNPSNGETSVKISVTSPTAAKISVVNVLGQTVYSQSANLNSGSNNVQFNVAEFAPGVYNVVIDSKNGSVVKKLNVTK